MPRMNEAIARESRARREAIAAARQELRGIKGRNDDERQFNVAVQGSDWWVLFRMTNRQWVVVTVERWLPR